MQTRREDPAKWPVLRSRFSVVFISDQEGRLIDEKENLLPFSETNLRLPVAELSWT